MSNDRQLQLALRRPHLRDIPPVTLPLGYSLRSYQPSDDEAWNRIICETFKTSSYDFDKAMRQDAAFKPERVLFIVCGDEPVATASAWLRPQFGPNTGYVHMVGTLPSHQGKRLGYYVSLGVLHRFREDGRIDSVLFTDDFRIPAIKTYIRLGFEPLLIQENQRQRWQMVLKTIAQTDLESSFKPILEGPLVKIEGL